jgi:D-erythrulose 1-phosphate 3-epimerase
MTDHTGKDRLESNHPMKLQHDPRIYLAIDNCFASKRWTKPAEWMTIASDLGLTCVEASADTECDPLYMGPEYMAGWTADTLRAQEASGVRVINLFSGHGTYSTLGLGHTDERVRLRMRDSWLKPQMDAARALGAGLGYYVHAVDDRTLQDPAAYTRLWERLYEDFAGLARYASDIGVKYVSLEQMYTPHQPPWRVADCLAFLREVYGRSGCPHYITLDIGHMNGQRNFLRPTRAQITQALEEYHQSAAPAPLWLGPGRASDTFNRVLADPGLSTDEGADRVLEAMDGYDHLFAEPQDACADQWLEALGAYSPILHLQQTDGMSSPHWPFDPAHNGRGVIHPKEVIHALERACSRPEEPGMPPRCKEIALTLEIFVGTGENPYKALEAIRESVHCWRAAVPADGMLLSDLSARLAPAETAERQDDKP